MSLRLAPRSSWMLPALLAVVLLASTAPGQTPAPSPPPRTRFVAIYDSHGLTPYGDRLDTILLGLPGADLVSVTLGGASPSWFDRRPISPRGYVFDSTRGEPLLPRARLKKRDVRTPVLADLLRVPEGRYARQVVIVTLGSNVPGLPPVQTAPVERIVRSIDAALHTVCIWVGPPAQRRWSAGFLDRVYAAIREGIRAAGRGRRGVACHLVDSRRFSAYPPGGDGAHYGFTPRAAAAAHRWAEGVAGEIDHVLRGVVRREP